ncbi:unnamed protein product [Bursaphelenchus xylophilus]|uniref:nicotinamidase n=1 Tax=Bursaphelenchus xylophilus TaxID=6326 RepID=A0A1I7S5D7_BURXY|nr:unnamed protein product [Bursaphelenchus xylophilus]CAG9117963.1 unnamed protein product [Bursaphelenchus xylophilus]
MVELKKRVERIPENQKFEEFAEFLRSLIADEQPNEESLRRVFNVFDKDADGVLNEKESRKANAKLVDQINGLKSAFVLVDFQNDFVDGSLGIKHGRARQDPYDAIPKINSLLDRHNDFDMIVYTLDWHPQNHISFYEHCRNNDRTLQKFDRLRKLKPFDIVSFENPPLRQVLYPSHCMIDSWGAALHDDIKRVEPAKYVTKGSDVYVDSYSGFADNTGQKKTELEGILKEEAINALFVCGVSLDICVASTARDAAKLKFFTCIIEDCSKGLSEDQIKKTRDELRGRNVPYVTSEVVNKFLDDGKIPWLWICHMVGLGERRHRRHKHRHPSQSRSSSEASGEEGEVLIKGHGPTRELLSDSGLNEVSRKSLSDENGNENGDKD